MTKRHGVPAFCSALLVAYAAVAQEVVVEVDGAKLTQSELDAKVMQAIQSKGMHRLPPDTMAKVKAELQPRMIEGFISKVLLQNEANRQGIKAPAKEIDQSIAKIKANFPNQAAFAAVLAQSGATEAELRADIETELKIRQLLDKRTVDLPKVTETEISAFYLGNRDNFRSEESVHVRHVLVAFAKGDSDKTKTEKKAIAEKIRQKVVDGTDFATVASDHSDCPSSQSGGDLGTFSRKQKLPLLSDAAFEQAAFKQKVNDVGPVVTTRFGHHIIQVLAHTPASQRSLEDVSKLISDYLAAQREEEAVLKYIEGLKGKAKIKYPDPPPEE